MNLNQEMDQEEYLVPNFFYTIGKKSKKTFSAQFLSRKISNFFF